MNGKVQTWYIGNTLNRRLTLLHMFPVAPSHTQRISP
jgi:hypothetical protein